MADRMKSINWKDVAARTVKTFVASFVPALSVDLLYGISDAKGLAKGLIATILSAASAGITAVWNMLLEMFRDPFNAWIDRMIDKILGTSSMEMLELEEDEDEEEQEPDADEGDNHDGWIC